MRSDAPGRHFMHVEVGGLQRPEYNVKNEGNLHSGFIESKPGMPFVVRVGHDAGYGVSERLVLSIDGQPVVTNALHGMMGPRSFVIRGKPTSDWSQERPFMFAKVETGDSDDEDIVTGEFVLKNLACIEATFTHAVYASTKHTTSSNPLAHAPPPKVHEKAKKLSVSEITTFGAAVSCGQKAFHTLQWKAPHPTAVLRLEYRSGPILEMMGIELVPDVVAPVLALPARQNPDAEAESLRLETLASSEQIAELPAQLDAGDKRRAERALEQAKPKRIKGERRDRVKGEGEGEGEGKVRIEPELLELSDEDDVPLVKRERPRVKMPEIKPGEVLDLTSD